MAEGFMVKSRWGFKQHQPACTCGVCKSKRKEHNKSLKHKAEEPSRDNGSSGSAEYVNDTHLDQQTCLPSAGPAKEPTSYQQHGQQDRKAVEPGNSDIENQHASAAQADTAHHQLQHQDAVLAQKAPLKVALAASVLIA